MVSRFNMYPYSPTTFEDETKARAAFCQDVADDEVLIVEWEGYNDEGHVQEVNVYRGSERVRHLDWDNPEMELIDDYFYTYLQESGAGPRHQIKLVFEGKFPHKMEVFHDWQSAYDDPEEW